MDSIITNFFSKKQISTRKNQILAIISVLLLISMGRTIYTLLGRDDIIEKTKKDLEIAQAEQKELLKLKEKVTSEEFIEKEARDKLGLAKEGEVVVVLPDKDSLKKLSPPDEEEVFLEIKPPWKQWVEMFFRPQGIN